MTLEDRYRQAEQRSVDAIQSGDLAAAERELRPLLSDAEAAGDFTALFLHYERAWLCWAAGDIKGSLDELRAAEAYMDRAQLMGHASAYQHLNILWLRAFFLLELANEAPASSRVSALARAQAVRREHEARAGSLGEQARADLLAALFAVRSGNPAPATKRSQSFHLIEEPDPAELFVMILVYLAIGDSDAAIAARQKIQLAEPGVLRSLALARTVVLDPEYGPPQAVPSKHQ